MKKRKNRYTELPGVMHGGEKSPIKMVNAASTTGMNTVNQPLVTGPLMKGEAGLMGGAAARELSMINLQAKYAGEETAKETGGKVGANIPTTKKEHYKKK